MCIQSLSQERPHVVRAIATTTLILGVVAVVFASVALAHRQPLVQGFDRTCKIITAAAGGMTICGSLAVLSPKRVTLPPTIRELLNELITFYEKTEDVEDTEENASSWMQQRAALVTPYREHINLLIHQQAFFDVVTVIQSSSKVAEVQKVLAQFPDEGAV